MDFNGSTVYTEWKYKPLTTPAIKWVQVANGNWNAVDRGTSEDIFEGDIRFVGPEAELQTLEAFLDSNREAFNATFGEGEEIFGADIDYSSALSVTVVKYEIPQRISFSQFGMGLRLRLVGSPSFVATSPSLSNLRIANWSYSAGSQFDIDKKFTYDRTASYLDTATDPGIFKANFLQTQEEMEAIRRYLLVTARTATVAYPTSIGITEPFGQRVGVYTGDIKITGWKDLGRQSLINWGLSIDMRRVFA